MNSNEEVNSNELPLEYQVFALSFQDPDAIKHFAEHLPIKAVGALDNSLGLKEFYSTLLSYYDVTKSAPIDPIGFRSWLETETDLYAAINELVGIDAFMDTIINLKVSNPEQISAILKSRANKKAQIDALGELQTVLNNKTNKTEGDAERIEELTQRIRQLEHSVGFNPLEGLTSTEDIKNGIDDIFAVPNFLPTPYKAYNKALAYSAENGGYVRGAVHAVVATSGSGKPLSIETPILMSTGRYKRLGDIKAGDSIVNSKGMADKVLAVHEQGLLDCIKITTRSGRTVISARDHGFLTSTGEWVEAKDLTLDHKLVIPSTIVDHGQHKQNELMRLVGYVIGDGAITSGNQNITCFDEGVLNDLQSIVPTLGYKLRHVTRGRYDILVSKGLNKVGDLTDRETDILYCIGLGSSSYNDIAEALSVSYNTVGVGLVGLRKKLGVRFFDDLEEEAKKITWTYNDPKRAQPIVKMLDTLGVRGGSHTKSIPDWVYESSHENIGHLLGAYFSADGYVSHPREKLKGRGGKQTPTIELYSVQKDLLESTQRLLAKLGIHSRLSAKRGQYLNETHWSWRLTISNPIDVSIFSRKVYLAGDKLDRLNGWSVPELVHSDYIVDGITYLEEVGQNECRCLTIEEDHTFLANDLVVHNSTLTKNLCNHWLDLGYKVLFINYEETRNHWEKILLSQIIEKNVYAHYDEWSDDEKTLYRQRFCDKLDEWGDRLKIRHSPDSSYYHDLERWLRDIINDGTWIPDIIVIDTIQSLITKGTGPRWGDYETIMINLERLAKDFDAAVVVTAQQNNDAVKENREIVKQSDIGGGVTIVQKCSIITVITEPVMAGVPQLVEGQSVMQLQIPKNRITGKVVVSNMPTILYDDESKSYKDHVPTREELELNRTYEELLQDI